MPINSKKKGSRGELEFANWLKDKFKLKARRGQQFSGGEDSPDVICEDLPDIHLEIKRTERLHLYDAIEQASRDSGTALPLVFHRKSRKPWVAILDAYSCIELILENKRLKEKVEGDCTGNLI